MYGSAIPDCLDDSRCDSFLCPHNSRLCQNISREKQQVSDSYFRFGPCNMYYRNTVCSIIEILYNLAAPTAEFYNRRMSLKFGKNLQRNFKLCWRTDYTIDYADQQCLLHIQNRPHNLLLLLIVKSTFNQMKTL